MNMNKIYRLSIFVAALVLLVACVKETTGPEQQPPREVTVTAGVDTKTLLVENSVMWENGDEIAMVFTHSESQVSSVTPLSTSFEEGSLLAKADFSGTMASEISVAAGYAPEGFAVYPMEAVAEDGSVNFTLPSVQTAHESGSFASKHNLSSGVVSLVDIDENGSTDVTFRNALSVLRFELSPEVSSITLTGTSSFAGRAPLKLYAGEDDAHSGRLVVDTEAEWTDADKQTSVSLVPVSGDTFASDVVYNLLIWPGTHTSLSIAIDFKDLGVYERTLEASLTFEPAKYYTLNFNVDAEAIVTALEDKVGSIEDDLSAIKDRIEKAEDKAEDLGQILSQIQSVALMGDYADNSVLAPYAAFSSSKMKMDITLDYIIRPAAVAAELVENHADAFSATVAYRTTSGLQFSTLPVSKVALEGDVMSVKVNAESMSDAFYAGSQSAELALQISDGNTDVLSDFAKLVPSLSSAIRVNRSEDLPVISGASVSIPFTYATASGSVPSFTSSSNATVRDSGNGNGIMTVNISDSAPVESQNAQLVLKDGEIEFVQDFTFVEGGKLIIETDGPVDHIGGEVVVTVTQNDFSNGPLELTSGSDWCSQSNMIFSCTANNSSSDRFATADYKITNLGLTYTKTVTIKQYGTSTPLQRIYYTDGTKMKLNSASAGCAHALNIVILGDGFMKKDLSVGGKFERTARSAMETFFSIEPFTTFRDRFDVYMVTYESAEEGIDVRSANSYKNTYFDAWCEGNGNTLANCDDNKVIDVVKNVVGLDTDAEYYRTIAIILGNTSENVGSCAYPVQTTIDASTVGDGYASFAKATLAAYSTGTNGLIKHEAGGHAFGRLGDEYDTGNASRSDSDLDKNHNRGYYQNISYATDASCPWYDLIGYDGTGCYEGAWSCSTGYYRPSQTSIMLNNQGEFNAPSRRIIYKRIIQQTEGWKEPAVLNEGFLTYDSKNL